MLLIFVIFNVLRGFRSSSYPWHSNSLEISIFKFLELLHISPMSTRTTSISVHQRSQDHPFPAPALGQRSCGRVTFEYPWFHDCGRSSAISIVQNGHLPRTYWLPLTSVNVPPEMTNPVAFEKKPDEEGV